MQDVTTLTKDGLMSELNALNYSEWTREDKEYRDKLEAEYHKRIENECAIFAETK